MNKESDGKIVVGVEDLAGRAEKPASSAEELAGRLTGMTRQNAAKTVHDWLRKVCLEPDDPDIEAALRLRDIYDCHACVEHVAQVYVKGIMTARGGLFGMKEEISEREALEIAERANEPAKRVRVGGVNAQVAAAGVLADERRTRIVDEPVSQPDDELSPQLDDGVTVYDLIIDVRSAEEYAERHREGAVNVPLAEFLANPVAFVTDKDEKILFVCQKGIKSRIAAEAAIRHGFWKVCYAGEQ